MSILHKLKKVGSAPKIVLIGNFGVTNVGDELILAGFLKKLAREYPRTKVTVLSHNPQTVRRWHGVVSEQLLPLGIRSLLTGRLGSTLKVLKSADAIIFPGGGLFTDTENLFAIILWGAHLLAARYFWKPVYLLGQSVGPFTTQLGRKLARFVLSKAELISVRDQASQTELTNLGIPDSKIENSKDLAFFLVSKTPKIRKLKKAGRLRILISVRQHARLPDNFFAELTQALDWLTETRPVRLTFTPWQTLSSDDHRAWQEVCTAAKHSNLWKSAELPESAEEVLQTVGQYDLVIGMRLHSLITAHLMGIPSLGLAYDRKVSEFQQSISLGKTTIETRNFTVEKFKKAFAKVG